MKAHGYRMSAMRAGRLLAGVFCGMLAEAGQHPAAEPEAVLRAVDRSRGNVDGIEWQVRVEAQERGRTSRESFHVWARGSDILAVTDEPPTRRGNRILVQKGQVWFYRPGLSRPVPISHRQRLLGLASYGDIAATDYAKHYAATDLPDEAIDGEQCRVFDLRARHRAALYDRVVLWVSHGHGVAVRADYYTRSGMRIKTARLWHEHRVEQPDGTALWMCSRIELTGDLAGADVTRIHFSAPVLAPLPGSLFNVNRLGQ